MSNPRKPREKAAPETVQVVRRPREDRKRLPPELEAFARSDEKKLRTHRPQTPQLRDPRPVMMVPGVANRDARLVADARLEALDRLVTRRREGEDVAQQIETALAEAILVSLWRGKALTGFDAMVENLLGLAAEDAMAMATRGAERLGVSLGARSEAFVAVWLRAEAALVEHGFPGRASVRVDADRQEHLILELPLRAAPEAIQEIGRRMAPLVHDKMAGR